MKYFKIIAYLLIGIFVISFTVEQISLQNQEFKLKYDDVSNDLSQFTVKVWLENEEGEKITGFDIQKIKIIETKPKWMWLRPFQEPFFFKPTIAELRIIKDDDQNEVDIEILRFEYKEKDSRKKLFIKTEHGYDHGFINMMQHHYAHDVEDPRFNAK